MIAPVSFIIPAYNCADTLAQTAASIFDGNFESGDELVIVNDASSDETAEVIKTLQHRNASINSVLHRHNRGGGAARNTAVENARHELLFCLDSDNVLAPGSIPRLRGFMQENLADVASFGELHYFVKNSSDVTHKWIFKPGQTTLADYLAGAIVPGASGNYLFTRESWLKARGYPESAGALDAWGFGLRQVATGQKMWVMPNSYYYHRYGHDSYWLREARKGNTSLTALQLLIPYLENFELEDIEYIMGQTGRTTWFERLDERPLRVKTGQRGVSGAREGGVPESVSVIKLARRLLAALARSLGAR